MTDLQVRAVAILILVVIALVLACLATEGPDDNTPPGYEP